MAENSKYYYAPLSDLLHLHHEKFEKFGLLINVLMCLLCLAIWFVPTAFSNETIIGTRALIAFEFIILHSALFMMISYWVFIPLYFLFAFSFNHFTSDNAIMITFLVIVLNRVRFIFMKNGDELGGKNVVRALYQFFLNYFPLMFLGVVFQSIGLIPELGLSEETIKNKGIIDRWDYEHPTVMAVGFFYYLRAIYLDKKLKQSIENRDVAKEMYQSIVIIGTDIVEKRVAARLSTYLNSGILITNQPESITENKTRDDLLDKTPAKWYERYKKYLQLKGPEEISEKPKMIVNTAPIEEAVSILNSFGKGMLERVIILDLSKIEYFSNRLKIDEVPQQSLSEYFPKNSIVELTTNLSCEGLLKPQNLVNLPSSSKNKVVTLKGDEQYAIDKVRVLLHGLGWKDEQINQVISTGKFEV